MPKRKSIPNDEPLVSRPQRNTRAKKVFDPSDNYLPKRRNKPTVKHDKPTETAKKNNHEKKKTQNTKSKNSIANESLSSSPGSLSYMEHVLIDSHIKQNCSVLCPENSLVCVLCTKSLSKLDLVDCPICLVTAHKNCILVDEPIWKFKLDKCVWLCKNCREVHCSKCLKNESISELSRRCITCKVGLHLDCYESYDIKPLHTLQINMYVCIPCMTLAIHKLPEEEDEIIDCTEEEEGEVVEEEEEEEEKKDEEEFDDDDEVEDLLEEERETIEIDKQKDAENDAITIDSSSSSVNIISSDEENDDLESNKSYDSLLDFDRDQDIILSIPDISNWSKYQVYEYLTDRLPKEILTKIIKNDIDGHSLKLLKRTDITFDMGLKLGPALKLYKEVRILQTQSTYHAVFWE